MESKEMKSINNDIVIRKIYRDWKRKQDFTWEDEQYHAEQQDYV